MKGSLVRIGTTPVDEFDISGRYVRAGALGSETLFEHLNRQLDTLYGSLLSVATVLKFNILRTGRANKVTLYATIGQTFAMIIGHYYMFFYIHHPIPSELPILSFTMPAFSIYIICTHGIYKVSGTEYQWSMFKGRRISFVSFHLSQLIMEVLSVIAACALVCAVLYMFGTLDVRSVGDSFQHSNFPLFISLLVVAYVLGYSFGSLANAAFDVIPGLNASFYVMMPVIFVTSGVYSSYNLMPSFLRDVFKFNPLVSIVEKARQSIVLSYSTPDLSLTYPVTLAVVGVAVTLMFHSQKERLAL